MAIIDRYKPKIPFLYGESLHKSLQPEQTSTLFLSAGRWCLSPRSTVPYAQVDVLGYGGKEVSWGQLIEIPDDSQGTVKNSSFHAGDVIFDAAGSGTGFVGFAPATITVPAQFILRSLGLWHSTLLDVRRARKAYLCIDTSITEPNNTSLQFRIYHQAPRRGTAFVPGTAAANAGAAIDVILFNGASTFMLPLGFASGQTREPAPGVSSLQELRPMCFLDYLFVEYNEATPGNPIFAGGNVTSFFLLEY